MRTGLPREAGHTADAKAHKKVGAFLAVGGIFSLNTGLNRPVFALFARSLGANPVLIGLFETVGILANAITRPLWGNLSDTWGRRRTLLIGLGITELSLLVLVIAWTPWFLFLKAVLVGVGAAAFWPSIKAALADVYVGQREKAFAYTSATQATSQALGAAASGLVTVLLSYRGVFAIGAILMAGASLLGLRLPTPPNPVSGSQTTSTSEEPVSQANVKSRRLWWQGRYRVEWLLGLAFGIMGLGFSVAGPFLALYLNDVFGVNPLIIGFIFTGFSGAWVLGSLITPHLTRWLDNHLSRPVSISGGLVVAALLFSGLMLAPLPIFVLLLASVRMIESVLLTLFMAMITDRFPERMGRTIGLFESLNMGVGAIGPVLGGVIYSLSAIWLFPISALIVVSSAALFFVAAQLAKRV